MANGAFTGFGMLTPEQAAQAAQERELQAASQDISPVGLAGRAGFQVGQALGGLFGLQAPEAPEVTQARKQAEAARELAQLDLTTAKGLGEAANVMNRHGFVAEAFEFAKQFKDLAASTAIKPTAAAKKQAELEAQGMDSHIAQGIAYGTYKMHNDPVTGDAYIVDTRDQGQRVSEDVADVVGGHVKANPYKPKLIKGGTKEEVRLQKDVKDLSDDMGKTGVPRTENILSTIEGIIASTAGEGSDLPGFGLTQALPDWAVSQQGQDLRQAVTQLFNIELKERSGAAVTKQELDRLKNEFKSGFLKDDRMLINAIQRYRSLLEDYKQSVIAGYDPAVVARYQEQGGIRMRKRETETPETKSRVSAAQIRADGRKYGWTEQQINDAIKKYGAK